MKQFLQNLNPNSAWDGRIGPIIVSAAAILFVIAIAI